MAGIHSALNFEGRNHHADALPGKRTRPEIRVNAIAPGTITMPGDLPELEADFVKLAPLHRSGRPNDIVAAVSYLASAGFVTGQVLVVDGGRTL